MEAVFFWIFAVAILAFGLGVVLGRSPVGSALCLVATFVCLAGLIATLEAFFIAVTQVIVYAGAVMVLFLFVIMLLDLKGEQKRPVPWVSLLLCGGIVALFGAFFMRVLHTLPYVDAPLKWGQAGWTENARELGRLLFTGYTLPFLLVALLLLVATVGVVHLSRKDAP